MTYYQETELDERRYLHDAVYHANRELVKGLVDAGVLVPVEPDSWYCGHLKRMMPLDARSRSYCLEGHLIPTKCGPIAWIGGSDDTQG